MFDRRAVLAGLAATPFLTSALFSRSALAQDALQGDTLATSAGDVTIHPVSHASLVLSWGDQVAYIDPVGADLFAGLPAPTMILITHQHGDHFDLDTLTSIDADAPMLVSQTVFDGLPDALKASATVAGNGESIEFAGVPVEVVAAYNTTPEREQYHPKGVGNGYVLTLGDKKVYIAGDTEDTQEMRALTGIDVAFLPMNLPYTMTEEQAADAVKAFRPAVVYPYHFRDSDVEKFKTLVGDASEVRIADWYPAGA